MLKVEYGAEFIHSFIGPFIIHSSLIHCITDTDSQEDRLSSCPNGVSILVETNRK